MAGRGLEAAFAARYRRVAHWRCSPREPCPSRMARAELPMVMKTLRSLLTERVERLLESIRVRPLGLRERLEPVRDLLEALAARSLRHAGVHVGVLVSLARDGRLQVVTRLTDRQTRGRIAD